MELQLEHPGCCVEQRLEGEAWRHEEANAVNWGKGDADPWTSEVVTITFLFTLHQTSEIGITMILRM